VPRSTARFAYWLVPLLVAAALVLSLPFGLEAAGEYLVYREEPFPAEVAVVLAGGERTGNRILKAAELARQGLVKKVLVSGPPAYGRHESDLAIEFAVGRGYPREWFLSLPHAGSSTWEEARLITQELRRLEVKRYLLVTSDYHTRRARACFRRAAPELELRVVGAPDEEFPRPWWKSRAGRKTFLLEWLKTLAWWAGF